MKSLAFLLFLLLFFVGAICSVDANNNNNTPAPQSAWFFAHSIGVIGDGTSQMRSQPYPMFKPDGTQFFIQLVSSQTQGTLLCLADAIDNSFGCQNTLLSMLDPYFEIRYLEQMKSPDSTKLGAIVFQLISVGMNQIQIVVIDLDTRRVVIQTPLFFVDDDSARYYTLLNSQDFYNPAPQSLTFVVPNLFNFSGATEMILSYSGSAPYYQLWNTTIPIPDYGQVYQHAHAHDFTITNDYHNGVPMIAFLQMDRLFFLDSASGNIVSNPGAHDNTSSLVPNPFVFDCGTPIYNYSKGLLRMTKTLVLNKEVFIMFGNTNYSSNNPVNNNTNSSSSSSTLGPFFHFCGISIQISQDLNPFLQYTHNESISLVNGAESFKTTITINPRTQSYTTVLFISGQTSDEDFSTSTFFGFSLNGRTSNSTLSRFQSVKLNFFNTQRVSRGEAYNMPVDVIGKDGVSSVAVSLGGVFQGIDPLTGQRLFTCPSAIITTNSSTNNSDLQGCHQTATAVRNLAGSFHRFVCYSGVGNGVIAWDIAIADQKCTVAWFQPLPSTSFIPFGSLSLESKAAIAESPKLEPNPLNKPFIAIADYRGLVFTMGAQRQGAPIPPPAPTPVPPPTHTFTLAPPTPAPPTTTTTTPVPTPPLTTRSPDNHGPPTGVLTQHLPPNGNITDTRIYQEHGAVIQAGTTMASNTQTVVAATALATVIDNDPVYNGTTGAVFYLQVVEFPLATNGPTSIRQYDFGFSAFFTGTLEFPSSPVIIGASAHGGMAAAVVYDTELLVVLSTYFDYKTNQPTIQKELFNRFGAITPVASDLMGTFFYNTGVIENSDLTEFIYCNTVTFDGQNTYANWIVALAPPPNITSVLPNVAFSEKTVHVGNLQFAQRGYGDGLLIYSYLNELQLVNAQSGYVEAIFQNPCGFVPALDSYVGYYPMVIYTINAAPSDIFINMTINPALTKSFAFAVIYTEIGETSFTVGVCAVDLDSMQVVTDPNTGYPLGIILSGLTGLDNIVSIGNTGKIFIAEVQQSLFESDLKGFDVTTGQVIWSKLRVASYGSTVKTIPNSNYFATNLFNEQRMDVVMNVFNASSGAALAACEFPCREFVVYGVNVNASIMKPTFVCILLNDNIRAFDVDISEDADPSNLANCNPIWTLPFSQLPALIKEHTGLSEQPVFDSYGQAFTAVLLQNSETVYIPLAGYAKHGTVLDAKNVMIQKKKKHHAIFSKLHYKR